MQKRESPRCLYTGPSGDTAQPGGPCLGSTRWLHLVALPAQGLPSCKLKGEEESWARQAWVNAAACNHQQNTDICAFQRMLTMTSTVTKVTACPLWPTVNFKATWENDSSLSGPFSPVLHRPQKESDHSLGKAGTASEVTLSLSGRTSGRLPRQLGVQLDREATFTVPWSGTHMSAGPCKADVMSQNLICNPRSNYYRLIFILNSLQILINIFSSIAPVLF